MIDKNDVLTKLKVKKNENDLIFKRREPLFIGNKK